MAKCILVPSPSGGLRLGVSGGRIATDTGGAPCCCEPEPDGPFMRATDCCSGAHIWFRIDDITCQQTLPGEVVHFGGKCWALSGTILGTREEIEQQYPGEQIADTNGLACLPDRCQDEECPPCDECCYVSGRDPGGCPNDCTLMGQRCNCGKEWTVIWNLRSVYIGRGCTTTSAEDCQRIEFECSGSATFQYKELTPGAGCTVVLVALSATSREVLTWLGTTSCTGPTETYNQNFDMTNPGAFHDMVGCGQSPAAMKRVCEQHSFFQTCLFPSYDGCNPRPDCLPCNIQCHVACGGQAGFPGQHHVRSGVNTCTTKELHWEDYDECDIGCARNDECVVDFSAGIFIQDPCDDRWTGGGGVEGGAGGVPAGATF